jgi:hypothetical protein
VAEWQSLAEAEQLGCQLQAQGAVRTCEQMGLEGYQGAKMFANIQALGAWGALVRAFASLLPFTGRNRGRERARLR